ncbi:MAG: hypothetical protein OER86_12900, partial [Phycisphaerae bacterium]|nr:hypothetical protein [Phycisphaerae bacterium]
RTLPAGLTTAYPRQQTACPDPQRGLASIEALYVARFILGQPANHLLDGYRWAGPFLERNADVLNRLRPQASRPPA